MKDYSLLAHRRLKGKISVVSKKRLTALRDLQLYYTPGVGSVVAYLAKHKKLASELTIKSNSVAVVSDGSAVLGLGNVGPEAAIPVMEGKAMIFKEFGGIDAFPIILNTQNTDEIVKAVKWIEPVFGGINLEDISAPRCFEIEKKLRKLLNIPVIHDDQHGAAIVVLAGLINAFRVRGSELKTSKIVIIGAGAAGSAITHLLYKYGVRNIICLDSQGIISRGRRDMDFHKKELAKITNKENIKGGLTEAIKNADAAVGVSRPGLLLKNHIKMMAPKPIVFALANPVPEIMPKEARAAGAFIVATGRSDFKNQINNALVFPGLFRGVLDRKVRVLTDKMKIRAARALANLTKKPTPEKIIASILDKRVAKAVARAIY